MLIPVKMDKGLEVEEVSIDTTTFRSLNLTEGDLEEFLRVNIGVIFPDETLLIVGKQVKNNENGRSDLTAIDENGNLVLIELKRDLEDIKQRKEAFEFQAIRYAASYAKINSIEELVEKIFASYIEKHLDEYNIRDLTAYEKATRILNEFLEKNNASKTFNVKQRIILVASSFDNQTLSAVAWLISNGVDISCFEIMPTKIGNNVFLDVNRILPVTSIEDYYVEIQSKNSLKRNIKEKTINRKTLPKMNSLLEWGILKSGQELLIKNFDNSLAKVIDSKFVEFQDKKMAFNEWGKKVTGWSTINIYEWAILKESNKSLHTLRKEKMDMLEQIEEL